MLSETLEVDNSFQNITRYAILFEFEYKTFMPYLIEYYEILNTKVGQKYCTSYIIDNVIFRPHWLKLFSNWSKYNA